MIENDCKHYCLGCDSAWVHLIVGVDTKCSEAERDKLCPTCQDNVDGGQVATSEKVHTHICEQDGEKWSHRDSACVDSYGGVVTYFNCPEHS